MPKSSHALEFCIDYGPVVIYAAARVYLEPKQSDQVNIKKGI